MNPRLLAIALSGLLVVTGVLAVVAGQVDTPPRAHADEGPPASRAEAEALQVLRTWDDRRARAWATADGMALGRLYVAGSRSGQHDRAMLAAYAARGLRVTGLRMQVLEVAVRRSTGAELTLLVTDRVAGGLAVGHGVRVPLPADLPSTRLVSLVRVGGTWRVAEVQASAAVSTASTLRSVNR